MTIRRLKTERQRPRDRDLVARLRAKAAASRTWEIDAALANSPRGEPVPGFTFPAARSAVLSEDDVVRWLYVRPR